MCEKDLISIIIPIFNVEKYLQRCLDSVIGQTYERLEIILINDGSTDNCEKIMKDYAKNDLRIKCIMKSNGGLSSARNMGIDHARGQYLCFIDSDDYVSPDFVETLYKNIKQNDADICWCDAYFKFNEREELLKFDKKSVWLFQNSAVWNKMYKRDLFLENNIHFFEGIWYEDLEITPRLMTKSRKSVYVEKALYYYVQNEKSITRTFTKKVLDMTKVIKNLEIYFQSIGSNPSNANVKYIYSYICVYHGLCSTIFRMMNSNEFTNEEIKEYYYNVVRKLGKTDIIFKFLRNCL